MAEMVKKTLLLRQLVPKSYHFDGYSEVNCPSPRDHPFFADNVIPMGEHYLTTRLVDDETLSIEFSSSCQIGLTTFAPCLLSITDFATKIQEATKNNRDCIFLEITPNYQFSRKCDQNRCEYCNSDCSYLKTKRPTKVCAAVSFNFSEMKEALAMYFEITTSTKNGGKVIMAKRKNKFFGLNFEFGICKDTNIASTMMGVAVRNTSNGNWYVFDPKTQTRKNIANMKMGNFPMAYQPTNKFTVGRLYKIDGQYYYVKSVNPNGTVTLVSGADGIIRELIPEESIIAGMNFYTEVVAFDASTLMTPSGENVGGNLLAAIFMTQWAKGGDKAEFSLDDITDDSFNGLGAYLPLLMASGNGMTNLFGTGDGQSNFLTLMALSGEDTDSSELMQMMALNQLLNGGANNNPFAGGNIFPTPQIPTTDSADDGKICSKCALTYPADTNFCPKCGGKTTALATACFKCGAALMDGAAFCHKCGAKAGIPACSKCGFELTADSRFCSKCGTPVNEAAVPPVLAYPPGVRATFPSVTALTPPEVPVHPDVPDAPTDN